MKPSLLAMSGYDSIFHSKPSAELIEELDAHPSAPSLHALLPAGTEYVDDAEALPPAFRYWVTFSKWRLFVFPQDVQLASSVLSGFRPRGSTRKVDASFVENWAQIAKNNGARFFPLGLASPPSARWPIADSDREANLLVFRTAKFKDIGFFLDANTGLVDSVVKLPLTPPMLERCETEVEVLKELRRRNINVGPVALEEGTLPGVPGRENQPFMAQSFLTGEHPSTLSFRSILSFLEKLRLTGRRVTLRGLADTLRPRVEHLHIWDNSKLRLHEFLDKITDETELPSSILHGDLAADNVVVDERGRLMALDWEFAKLESVPFLDVLKIIFRAKSRGWDVDTFKEVMTPEVLAMSEKYRVHMITPKAPELEQFILLYFCEYFINRIELQLLPGSRYSKGPMKFLHSDWPL